jgi:hypothetical protein
MSAQILSRRRLNALSRRYALPFTYGSARGERRYRLHTTNHTIYYLTFTGTRPGRRSYVLHGPVDTCEAGRARLRAHLRPGVELPPPCVLNDLVLVRNPRWPGELTGVLR